MLNKNHNMNNHQILIITEHCDKSADIVCQWLYHWKKDYMRLNENDLFNLPITILFDKDKNETFIQVKGQKLSLLKVNTTWFRRGYFMCTALGIIPELSTKTNDSIIKHLENEGKTLEEFLYFILGQNTCINHPRCYNYNKLIALQEAKKLGFNIPPTIVSVDSNLLKKFTDKFESCISKSIQDLMGIAVNDLYAYTGKTIRVNKKEINPKGHWYSLFQKEIIKKYEIRVFYFLNKIYAMAIFSQMDEKSSLDFREVDANGKHPNRMVPFSLPNNITLKIRKLMKTLKLESGSLDFIVTNDNEYYFLEVNPVGQFNFLSEICNYHIEKNIAKMISL